MVASRQPSLFLPHGAPDLVISGHAAARFLADYSARLSRPEGIVIVSAHWQCPGLFLTGPGPLATIHDFGGFPAELYEIHYPASANENLVGLVKDSLQTANLGVSVDPTRGLDHGAWVPLSLLYPSADIPVVQLSLGSSQDGADHVAVGRALAPLRDRDIMIIGSGGSVHNLRALAPEGSPAPAWATAFDSWLETVLVENDLERLARFQSDAPHADIAHPSTEHFLPLLVSAGAGGGSVEKIHGGYSYGSIGMSAWAFR